MLAIHREDVVERTNHKAQAGDIEVYKMLAVSRTAECETQEESLA